MALTEEQRQAIRDEEFFRGEIRKELAADKPPATWLGRLTAFFETKAGFWLLTTALASLAATGFTAAKDYFARTELAKLEVADRARRDFDTVLKLAPMLSSDKCTDVRVALTLLESLTAGNAVDDAIANQVKDLVTAALAESQAACRNA